MTRCAVLGSGSWGTAFGKVLVDAGAQTVLWSRRPDVAARIVDTHANPDYLPGVRLPTGLSATADSAEALAGADFVILALPAQTVRANLSHWAAQLPPAAVVVSLMKGVELGSCKRMSEVVSEVADVPPERVAVLTGPNLAREIAAEQPAASVVASVDEEAATRLQRICQTGYFRPYTNRDVVGCELGGAVKNVIALACGMAEGMGFGDNTKASLMTRGLAETVRLGSAFGADPMTFAGLAGVGDLVATCTSRLSRNRGFGERLGRGLSVERAAAQTRQTAEGVKSCQSILELARRSGVDMPITEHVVAVVSGGLDPRQMVRSLMGRDTKAE